MKSTFHTTTWKRDLKGMCNKYIWGMNKLVASFISVFIVFGALTQQSCKSCNKKPVETISPIDTTSPIEPIQSINLPHADTSFIPILGSVLDEVFDASEKKDFAKLGEYIVYRGPDSLKAGYGVFDTRNAFDKKVVKITSEVFNKWNKDLVSREYSRVFEINAGNGISLPVMEVIFVNKKTINRKFFIFQSTDGVDWKIAETTSYL